MVARQMSPILKWAGGKTQLLDPITARMPKTYNRYYEPFIGGGAVWLAVMPEKAVINDMNEQLINLYRQMKENAQSVISFVNELDSIPCDKNFYYSIRERYNEKIASCALDAECAALMIWINKHCFNGLYRVNGKGLFNVPYNNKVNGKSIDEDNLAAIADYLNKADISITCLDFEEVCEEVRAGDFIYFDSPYIPISATADFTDYTKDGFLPEDHKRLAALFHRLDSVGALVMLSNNDVPLVHELYSGFKIQSLDVKRMINRNASKRTAKEVLITNY
ncbi:MAG: DNA adenine methylase [Acutalibacteraceae bacterium]